MRKKLNDFERAEFAMTVLDRRANACAGAYSTRLAALPGPASGEPWIARLEVLNAWLPDGEFTVTVERRA